MARSYKRDSGGRFAGSGGSGGGVRKGGSSKKKPKAKGKGSFALAALKPKR